MSKPIHRKEFLRISSLSALGLLLASCGFDTETKKTEIKADTAGQKTRPALLAKESEHVIYITKESEQYEALNVYFNKRIRKEPAIIALCKTTAGVCEAVNYAREHKLQIAVKSGGHSFEAFSNNTNGLVINLSLMNRIELSGDQTVQVGPGAKLHQLYDALLPQKRIVPAGSCAGVGVAGLTLGGGYGFFSRKYGLTCDSLTEVELVDGKGNIHSSASDKQLLWACRGGGNGNFGVVTKLVFKTCEAPAAFQSHRFKAFNLDTERAATILQKWFGVTATLPPACFGAYVLDAGRPGAIYNIGGG
ncbi:MAG: FAD-binding oxidoreductase, partial [Bacteroidia bacterium]